MCTLQVQCTPRIDLQNMTCTEQSTPIVRNYRGSDLHTICNEVTGHIMCQYMHTLDTQSPHHLSGTYAPCVLKSQVISCVGIHWTHTVHIICQVLTYTPYVMKSQVMDTHNPHHLSGTDLHTMCNEITGHIMCRHTLDTQS